METKPQPGLGEYLRSERERKQITIEQVASATKINIKLLHALEADNYTTLPAKPFVRGFVTSYTRYIGLDHREVLARFDTYLDEKSGIKFKRPNDAPHIFVEKEGHKENSKTFLTVSMVGFLVLAVIVFAIIKPTLKHHRSRNKDKATVSNEEMVTVVPPPSEGSSTLPEADKQVVSEAPTTVAAAPVPEAETKPASQVSVPDIKPEPKKPSTDMLASKEPSKPTPKLSPKPTPTAATTATPAVGFIKLPPIPNNEVHYRLVVRATEDAWVKYQVDDRPLQQYTLRAGKVIWVRARKSLRFTTAKPSAIEVSPDNKEFHPYGKNTKVIIQPKSAEAEFKDQPFVPPNPAYLSTPTPQVIHRQ